MPRVGDTVQVTISGGSGSSTNLGGAIRIGPGASMTVPGTIVADQGDSWVIELSISVGGKNRIVLPKSAQK